ncbi:hypothetical protein AX774_g2365 [Zancudomyces culisetae]|uniref:Uncharacterized protein n=1 Tax=Zancudomyces culisetae TaxID=1213189 RepID=A0A1R1PT50_ZANCU|nr:hypothetical protein AX774_g2365 [Zancudomyces culisetae]|eukprot:OMH84114.1 hypothetical protein AX774_g2365 [Zancudomyces culisetae]
MALTFGEKAMDIVKSLRPLMLAVVQADEVSAKIMRERRELAHQVTQLVEESGGISMHGENETIAGEDDTKEMTPLLRQIRERIRMRRRKSSKGEKSGDVATESLSKSETQTQAQTDQDCEDETGAKIKRRKQKYSSSGATTPNRSLKKRKSRRSLKTAGVQRKEEGESTVNKVLQYLDRFELFRFHSMGNTDITEEQQEQYMQFVSQNKDNDNDKSDDDGNTTGYSVDTGYHSTSSNYNSDYTTGSISSSSSHLRPRKKDEEINLVMSKLKSI